MLRASTTFLPAVVSATTLLQQTSGSNACAQPAPELSGVGEPQGTSSILALPRSARCVVSPVGSSVATYSANRPIEDRVVFSVAADDGEDDSDAVIAAVMDGHVRLRLYSTPEIDLF